MCGLQDKLDSCGSFVLIVLYCLYRWHSISNDSQTVKAPILMNKVQISLHNELHLTLQKKI